MRNIKWPVILASASPRRQELLRSLLPDFTVVPADLDEDALTDADPFVTAQRLAKAKAMAIFDSHPEAMVIAGDTVVALEREGCTWEQFSKPRDRDDAVRILGELSGKTHCVITGIAIRWPGGLSAFTEVTKVTFKPLDASVIGQYVESGEPMDKAGAYGIQGGAKFLIERVEGSVNNVIGLPTERLSDALKEIK